MPCRKALLSAAIILLFAAAGGASAYTFCDSTAIDSNAGDTLVCNITTQRYAVAQQQIDDFWQQLSQSQDYNSGGIKAVVWKIKGTVISVGGDLRFVEGSGVNVPWDMELEGDIVGIEDMNIFANWDSNQGPLTLGAKPTAIKKFIGGMVDYEISFQPLAGRRTVRNLTLTNEGTSTVSISGGNIKKAIVQIEGDLSLSNSFIENTGAISAQSITLLDKSYIKNALKIETGSLTVKDAAHIDGIGSMGEDTIALSDGNSSLICSNCSIGGVIGRISAEGDITLDQQSEITTSGLIAGDSIQAITAKNISVLDGSRITGIGGNGSVTAKGALLIDANSAIVGKNNDKPSIAKAASLKITNNSYLQGFKGGLKITGPEEFGLASGGSITDIGSPIESCAAVTLDGNNSKILFSSPSGNIIKAPSLDINNNAAILCIGTSQCDYNFLENDCPETPDADINAGPADNFPPGDTNAPADGNNGTQNGTAGIEIQPSATTASPGGTISITFDANEELESFLLENDFGAPPITTVPQSFPAMLGPFTIPAGTEQGVYSFTVSGTTKSGQTFERQALFSVGAGGNMPPSGGFLEGLLPIPLDFTAILAIALVGIAAAVTILMVMLKARRKKAPQAAAQQQQQKTQEQKPWEAQQQQTQQQAKQEARPQQAQPAAQEPAAPSTPSAGTGTTGAGQQELPPWLREENTAEERDRGF
ncbi:MAG: hypothetical protein NTW59_04395 [Candidatus Diapherotrites archaeon]|nr:hypothetical protein [Candidatus Diapherotrites archaeon]